MATDPTIGELFKRLSCWTPTWLTPRRVCSRSGRGYGLDLAAAVDSHGLARRALADPSASDGFKRAMVRTALLLAHPVKP
jgi:hypothetical protein